MLDVSSLAQTFHNGSKPESAHEIGVEWEKLGVDRRTGRAIPYDGPNGVEAIFNALIGRHDWQAVLEDGRPIALKKGSGSITLEPGGQIELSGQKAAALRANAAELHSHLKELRGVSEPLGIGWLGSGMQPISRLEDIAWVPKERYRVMRTALQKGPMTHAMMKQTASIQISLDYSDETDAVQKLRLAFALAPCLTAMFANSPVTEGRFNGYQSMRAVIWRNTAPERSGVLEDVFDAGFSFERYARYALDVPALFAVRDGRWIPLGGIPFGEYAKNGVAGLEATLEDWDLHLTTIFTEARLKSYIEIRSVDCQKSGFGMSAPALVKGLFYDAAARRAAWRLLEGWTLEERRRLVAETPVSGLKTRVSGGQMLDIARELTRYADEGLRRLEALRPELAGDAEYLQPLKDLLAEGKNPAEKLTERLAGLGSSRRVSDVIDAALI